MISSNNIFLRAIEIDDLDFIYNIENDTDLWQFGTTIAPLSKDSIRNFIMDSMKYDIYTLKQMRLIICKKDDNNSIGCLDITDFDPKNKRATVGIVIKQSERNKGFADEALKLTIDYAFKMLNLTQLYCEIADNNIISKSLFQANGFVVNGTKQKWIIINNSWHDVLFLQKINY